MCARLLVERLSVVPDYRLNWTPRSWHGSNISSRCGSAARTHTIVVEEAQIELVWFGRAQSIERLGDVLDANAVLDNPEVVIADGSDYREICGNGGHHQKINH